MAKGATKWSDIYLFSERLKDLPLHQKVWQKCYWWHLVIYDKPRNFSEL